LASVKTVGAGLVGSVSFSGKVMKLSKESFSQELKEIP
jgi:hypothetical protein